MKKAVNKAVQTSLVHVSFDKVRTVGFILDKKDFGHSHLLINELVKRGIEKENISLMVYNHDKGASGHQEVFVKEGDFTSSGVLRNEKVQAFVDEPFDLLINYYDVESLVLLWVSSHSKARFKVGFSSIKTHINNFSIALTTDSYREFVEELFKYLQLFKK